jgi:predicted amino acid racemase
MEKRRKLIPIKDLEHDVKRITKEAEAQEIDVTAVTKEKIETITLHKFLE